MKTKFVHALAAAVWACAGIAQATTLHNGSGLSRAHRTLDFEGVVLVPNQPVTTQFASAGVSFLNAFGNPDVRPYPNLSGNRLGNFRAGIGGTGLFTVNFALDLREVAFAIIAAPGTATFQAFLDGNLVDSFTGTTSYTDTNNFYGFQGVLMDRLTIRVQSFDRSFLLDNLQMLPVPEPQAGLLLVVGLAALVMLAQRRRRNVAD